MGGQAGYQLHLDYITKPFMKNGVDLRDMQTEDYQECVKKAILKDMQTTQQKPIFYALVIHSYGKNRLW